jgi:hypothetical protein
MPTCLDIASEELTDPQSLAEKVNPVLKLYGERYYQGGMNEDDVIMLRFEMAETGFMLGILFGAMMSNAPQREIDRLEKGFVVAMASRWWVCRDTKM